jgi:uncharacterized protein YndB with AHSA1/START domain
MSPEASGPAPTGRLERVDERLTLFVTRTFAAPIDDVWAAVTEPARLERWLGTWTGDPATGKVMFRMGFEGEGAGFEEMEIRECDAPRILRVTSHVGPYVWYLDVELSEADGVTTLAFSQPDVDHEDSLSVGPGWEYYLDRLVAVETGGDVSAIDFERDYYPAMSDHYRRQRDA